MSSIANPSLVTIAILLSKIMPAACGADLLNILLTADDCPQLSEYEVDVAQSLFDLLMEEMPSDTIAKAQGE